MINCPDPYYFNLKLSEVHDLDGNPSAISFDDERKNEDEVNAMEETYPLRIDSQNQKLVVRAVEGVEEVGMYTYTLYAFAFDEIPDVGNGNNQLVGKFKDFQISVLGPSDIIDELVVEPEDPETEPDTDFEVDFQ